MRLINAIARWFIDPSTLLAFAGVLAVAGLAGGYINVQQRAERELALRQGPPVPVAIEAFVSAVNMGPAREVRVRAVTSFEDPLILTHPESGKSAVALPLFPLAGGGDTAFGVILIEATDRGQLPDPAGLVAITGQSNLGTEVEVGGFAGRRGDFELMVAGALSVDDVRLSGSSLTILPFLNGRDAALEVPSNPPLWWLWCLSFASVLVAFAGYRGLWAAPRALERKRLYAEERAHGATSMSRPVTTIHFDPLASQEEVNGAPGWTEKDPSGSVRVLRAVCATLIRGLQAAAAFVLRPVIERLAEIRSSR